MPNVTMRHPEVENTISVTRSAAPIWGAAGWVEVDEPAPTTKRKPRRAAETNEGKE